MTLCLSHPEHGYYQTRDPLGVAGDFTTAPEISQMFGEIIGLWLAQCWMDQGQPSDCVLAELGPGRGTLMADILRATQHVPGFQGAMDLWLVETSPVLRHITEANLAGHHVNWAAEASSLPGKPLFLIANEFFDALPIRQVQKIGDQWLERCVAVNNDALTTSLIPIHGPLPKPCGTPHPDGTVLEISPTSTAIATHIHNHLKTHGGCALIIDYGDWNGTGDTLQALRAHASVAILDNPGTADLTAHVAFAALAGDNDTPTYFTQQGPFLERCGISERANRLLAGASDKDADGIMAAHKRLTHPDEMGTLFKVLAMTGPKAPKPPGFDP